GFGVVSTGVMYFNEHQTLYTTSDDIWGTVDKSTGLTSDNTTAVAVDQDGELWVGSTVGVDIISNPDAVLTDPKSLHVIKPYLSLLSGGVTYVTAILVDQLNNKWIGTNGNGLLVVSPDGSQLLESFTAENSPLLSDNVFSLIQDPHTGTVYAGTANGLSAVTNTPIASSASSTLRIGPQPFIVPSAAPMNIFGVNPNAEVKIFTVSGRLVRDFASGVLNDIGGSGGWDGKDAAGNWVASGIYFLVEVNTDGTMQEKKMAVIHQ
ncbi:MAG TPA: two-component regulator propeller domain-containing protein, partial [Candidatus Kapabacteria bacterium]|nr:two-component regulator propeller domain-containing protein [Candidatus Kapabacteria bacterium]